MLLLAGLGLGIGRGGEVGTTVAATLAQLPAVWVIGALAALLHGAAPRTRRPPGRWPAVPRPWAGSARR